MSKSNTFENDLLKHVFNNDAIALVGDATGRLYGSITPYTDLSPQTLAAAVIEAAQTSPIAADIRKVNAYTIDGDGSGTPWGPV